MSRNQRLSFLGIAAAIAVIAVVVLAAGGSDETSDQADVTPAPTGTPTATSTAKPKPKPKPPLLQAGSVKKLEYTEGDTVTFRVRHDAPEELHIHGYDIKRDLEPDKAEMVSFKADITGIFEIELEHSAQQLAELRVDPE
jgi:FtsP/CotA-like multicopper oxidase with cupredoxin domain